MGLAVGGEAGRWALWWTFQWKEMGCVPAHSCPYGVNIDLRVNHSLAILHLSFPLCVKVIHAHRQLGVVGEAQARSQGMPERHQHLFDFSFPCSS